MQSGVWTIISLFDFSRTLWHLATSLPVMSRGQAFCTLTSARDLRPTSCYVNVNVNDKMMMFNSVQRSSE
jgi:hypothetical protein